MGHYRPNTRLNRRRKIISEDNPLAMRYAMLGIFMILLAFFVALVAWSKPDDIKTLDILQSIKSTFRPLSGDEVKLTAPSDIPDWLSKNGSNDTGVLKELRDIYPKAFVASNDSWGRISLVFTRDEFQNLILTRPDLTSDIFKGMRSKRSERLASDDYMLEVILGTKSLNPQIRLNALNKLKSQLEEFGVHPTRLMAGYAVGDDRIEIKFTPSNRYEGLL